jgi:glycosyltransferase involved in cell wall biosynthesis
MIGVVIPAHNEAAYLASCLAAVNRAAVAKQLGGELVLVVVVLDTCSDESADIARQFGARIVNTNVLNVGIARGKGAEFAIRCGARWLAFTDADSIVAPDWIAKQLALNVDAVCGTVEVRRWYSYGKRLQNLYASIYRDKDGHSHIHGANLGVSAHAYEKAGGFRALECAEDVALVQDLKSTGASLVWSAAPRVVTSARCDYRRPAGFGAYLASLNSQLI